MISDPKALGEWGEEEAAMYLSRRGLAVLEKRYRARFGEVDLICRDRETVVFVEVKTRGRGWGNSILEAITPAKQVRLTRTALAFLKWKRLLAAPMRFDVLLIEGGSVEWIRNAFEPGSRYSY